jgi:CubicO group peptidase (beta-lactamase class C family)
MRWFAYGLAFLAGLSGACSEDSPGPGAGADAGPDAPPLAPGCEDLDARFEALRARFEGDLSQNGVPGGAFALVCGGAIRSAGLGVVKEGGPAVTSSTRFQLASITKMLTAAAALSLADEGLIDLEAPIATVMPTLAYGNAVSLHHLLAHASGLPTVFDRETQAGLRDLVLDNASLPAWSPPGAVWNYNNIGYAILGAVLEEASGRPFAALIGERVLGPFGLATATLDVAELDGDFAYGHSGSPATATPLGPDDSYYGDASYGPMGGAWASIDDLARLTLAPALLRQAEPVVPTGQSPGQSYGQGLFVDEGTSPTTVYHSGSVEGFLADLMIVPEAGVAAVAMVNCDWYFPQITAEAVSSLTEVTWVGDDTAPTADRLTGTYDSTVFGEVEIRSEGAGLVADFKDHAYSAPLQNGWYTNYEVEWRPESTSIPITFWLDGASAPAGYIVSPWGVADRR